MTLVIIFILGLAVGSFLNVLIDRLPRDESIIKGRSYCERCKKKLAWYDLVPVLSFFLLKGKCRYCRSSLSWQYPLVELVTGLMFVLTFFLFFTSEVAEGLLRGGSSDLVTLGYYLFIVSSLIAIFFTDLKYGIIPDKIIYPAILVSFLYLLLNTYYLIPSLLSAIGAFLFFLMLYFATKGKGMGFGDVKLVFLLGLFLGWPKIIAAFYIAFLTGAALGCILILWGKKKLTGGTIPFGPFLALGAIISFFWGEQILLKVAQGLL